VSNRVMSTMQALPTTGTGAPVMTPSSTSETSPLEALRRGDRRAAEAMVDETYAMVFASLMRMTGDRELAADLTQETYSRAWRSIAGFDGRSRLSTWLYRIAYTSFLNHRRRPRPWGPSLDDPSQAVPAVDPDPDPEARAAARREAERLRLAVLALPDALRFTVGAHYWGELSVREIARADGVSTVAIRKRLRKGLDALRRSLEENPS